MFKMGCSMAKRILAIDKNSSNNDSASGGSSSKKSKDKQHASAGESSGQNQKSKAVNADELGDFSKLEQDPRIPLNVRQIFKITKSWKAIARTMSKTGTAMFLNLFEQNQDLFYLFDRFQHLKGEDLHQSMELQEHAATVMSTLDQSISSLSDYDNFVTYLHSIGKLHRKVPGFKRAHFWKIEQPFLKAVKQTLDERCNETIEEIYKIAIKLIIETIADGYGEDQEGGGAAATTEAAGGGNDHQGHAGRSNGGGAGSNGNSNGGRNNSSKGGDNGSKTRDTTTGPPRGTRQETDGVCEGVTSALGGAKWKLAKDFDDNEAEAADCGREAKTPESEAASEPNHCIARESGGDISTSTKAIEFNKALEARSSKTTTTKVMRRMRTREPQLNIYGGGIGGDGNDSGRNGAARPEAGVGGEQARLKVVNSGGIILAADRAQCNSMAFNAFHDDDAGGGCNITTAIEQGAERRNDETNKRQPTEVTSQRGTLFVLSRLLPALVPTVATNECPATVSRSPLIIEETCRRQTDRGSSTAVAWVAQTTLAAEMVAAEEMGSGSLINCSQFDSAADVDPDKALSSFRSRSCTCFCLSSSSSCRDDNDNIKPNANPDHNSAQLTNIAAHKVSKNTLPPSQVTEAKEPISKSTSVFARIFKSIKQESSKKSHGPRRPARHVEKAGKLTCINKGSEQFSLSSNPGDLVELIKMLMLALAASRSKRTLDESAITL